MGAITGAATGAAEGAVAGAAVGAAAGHEKSKKDKASRAGDRVGTGIGRAVTGGSGRKMLLAEFFICIIILGLSPLGNAPSADSQDGTATDTSSVAVGAGQFMLKGTATAGLFLVLGMIAAIGPNVAKWSAGIGGLVTLAVVFNAANSFSGMVDAISSAKASTATPHPAPAPSSNLFNPPGTVAGSEVAGTPASQDTSTDATPPGQGNQGGIPGLGGF